LSEQIQSQTEANLTLLTDENGTYIEGDGMRLMADFVPLLKRTAPGNLNGESLIRAVRGKKKLQENEHPLLLDATGGLGEDSFLLAAAGYEVLLCEKNELMFALLEDGIRRGRECSETAEICGRMRAVNEDSLLYLKNMKEIPAVIYLDPMFPERKKSGLIKKKFQLMHQLAKPCENEEELFLAAVNKGREKVVVKRPAKGPYLAGRKPSYEVPGSVIRYDCYVL